MRYATALLVFLLYTVIHNYGNPYEKWNIFVARPHDICDYNLPRLSPGIILCETVLNLSTLVLAAARLLRTRPTFSRSLMVSVGVSALGTTSIHFIEPGVKVNGQYYREDLLMQKLLPDIRQLSDFYVFQVSTSASP